MSEVYLLNSAPKSVKTNSFLFNFLSVGKWCGRDEFLSNATIVGNDRFVAPFSKRRVLILPESCFSDIPVFMKSFIWLATLEEILHASDIRLISSFSFI